MRGVGLVGGGGCEGVGIYIHMCTEYAYRRRISVRKIFSKLKYPSSSSGELMNGAICENTMVQGACTPAHIVKVNVGVRVR